ncbi:parvulin-like peptidyl-prolyl cis-trans isomerase protein [Flavobacterium aquaticum]|uniref:Parvulin-like peptidyl-prolyl cis-trans isomerase protein n=1 Tax=Flavobacterium aquaticum TaxID=1236486 RepID=A0A327YXH8_9FLAO|nr:peptidylprolyl isomerase [Flavobacterium aquaticum]RAK25301.1 parvulin-like peptidyl-prolyl cis-trans isomerase protein [Flavobacterium aquaticum]
MKQLFTLLLLITFSNLTAQKIDLTAINSIEDAEKYKEINTDRFTIIDYIATTKDSLNYYKNQLSEKSKTENIKVLEVKPIVAMKVNYIFFYGKTLSKKEIDLKRKEILDLYDKGVSSDELVAKYTMDHNSKPGGNFGWIDDVNVEPTFREALKKHKKGDVFLVDTPELNWYYVVFKLYDDVEKVAIYYIKVL